MSLLCLFIVYIYVCVFSCERETLSSFRCLFVVFLCLFVVFSLSFRVFSYMCVSFCVFSERTRTFVIVCAVLLKLVLLRLVWICWFCDQWQLSPSWMRRRYAVDGLTPRVIQSISRVAYRNVEDCRFSVIQNIKSGFFLEPYQRPKCHQSIPPKVQPSDLCVY